MSLNNCSLYCKNFTMKATNSSASNYKVRGLVTLLYRYRVCSSNSSHGYPNHEHGTSFSKFCHVNDGSSSQRGLSMFSTVNNGSFRTPETIMAHAITENVQPSVPAPPRPSYIVWAKWLLGSLMPLILAFWKQKWNNLLKLEGEVEEIVEEVEDVAEVVEKVASTTEKISAEVAEALNDGRLKEAALMVEHVSSLTAKDAQLTKDFVDKVADLKQDLKDLETIAEPVINKIAQVEHGGN